MKKSSLLLFIALFSLYSNQLFPNNFSEHTLSDKSKYSSNDGIVDSVRYHVNRINALWEQIKTNGLISDLLNPATTVELPIGIQKQVGGDEFLIMVDSIALIPEGGYLNTYMKLPIPGFSNSLYFMGQRVAFNSKGLTGDAKLILLQNDTIQLNDSSYLVFSAKDQNTFVEFDCNGFKKLHINGELILNPNKFRLAYTDSTSNNKLVKMAFSTEIESWSDMLFELSIPSFYINKPNLKDYIFFVDQAVFDFSDTKNAQGIQFPTGYEEINPDAGQNTWRGFYVNQLRVKLPNQFNSGSDTTVIEANHFLIDDEGVTGNILAQNVINLDTANSNLGVGWKFSIDKVEADFLANKLTKLDFNGQLMMPYSDTTRLNYNGLYVEADDRYFMNVTLADNMDFNIWNADIELYQNSFIEVEVINGKFRPKAKLYGKMSINSDLIQINELSFDGLSIDWDGGIDVNAFSFEGGGQNSFNNFPITICDLELKEKENHKGLGFTVKVNFVNPDEGGFAADGSFIVWAEHKTVNGKKKWKYKNIEVKKILIDVETKGMILKGGLITYEDDPTYGKGFKGMIQASFLKGFNVSATAQFGKVNDYRYWYADALYSSNKGIPVFTGFGIYGFGGGAYYHMARQNVNSVSLPDSTTTNPVDQSSAPGVSLSGITYLPDNSIHLGIMATVVIGTHPSAKPFNADCTFYIEFKSGGGINKIGFQGDAYFMCSVTERNNPSIYAQVNLEYDFTNDEFNGLIAAYVNVQGIIKGTGENNKAGEARIFFGKDDWYIYVGTPDDRIGLEFIGLVKTTSYFMVGTQIPGFPGLPDKVANYFPNVDFDFMRDLNELGDGRGFAFGASIEIDKSFDKGPFYASFALIAGFDIMLKDYGEGAHCEGSSEPIGVNGWYAAGQMYAYLHGKMGIKVNLRFYKGSFDIFDISVGVVLQARLPNPSWMRGNIKGDYNILNGLVKGKCNFDFEVGEKCNIVGTSSLGGIEVIADVTPANSSIDVDVFTSPQVAFNYAVNQPFTIKDVEGNQRTFRIKLNHFNFVHDGILINGTKTWNPDNDLLVFESHDILPGEATIEYSVKVTFEEKKNGAWLALKENNEVVEEVVSGSFLTGPAPDYIPENNIEYSYPLAGQVNFHKDEHSTGYIQLKQGQAYLFEDPDIWDFKAKMVYDDIEKMSDLEYDANSKLVSYNIPSGLQNSTIYYVKLVRVPATTNKGKFSNMNVVSENVALEGESNMEINRKDLEGNIETYEENLLYETHIRTSKYATFSAKIDAMSYDQGWVTPVVEDYQGVYNIGLNLTADELFDHYEISGVSTDNLNVEPLVQPVAGLNSFWYNNTVKPAIYDKLPLGGSINVNWRTGEQYGIPPAKAIIPIFWYDLPNKLTETNISTNSFSYGSTSFTLVYRLPFIVFRDHENISSQAANVPATRPASIQSYLSVTYPNIVAHKTYYVRLKYVLPGINTVTTTKTIPISI